LQFPSEAPAPNRRQHFQPSFLFVLQFRYWFPAAADCVAVNSYRRQRQPALTARRVMAVVPTVQSVSLLVAALFYWTCPYFDRGMKMLISDCDSP
jgi:hypothetical protein